MRIKLYIVSLFFLSGILFAENTLSLEDNGDGTWNVNYSSEEAIGYFSIVLDDAIADSFIGGEAIDNNFYFLQNPPTSTIVALGPPLVPSSSAIPPGTGTLLVLEITGDPVFTGLSDLLIKDDSGIEIEDFTNQLTVNSELILRGSGAVFPGAKVFPTNPEPEAKTPFNAASKQRQRDKKAREEAAKRGAAKQAAQDLDYEFDAYTGNQGGDSGGHAGGQAAADAAASQAADDAAAGAGGYFMGGRVPYITGGIVDLVDIYD